jgi:chemotaxis protein histidine kinase CheA
VRAGLLDPRALARAEAALQALSAQFAGWMAEELAGLETARARLHAQAGAAAAWDELHRRAHDLKGLGTTYGHPLATRLCASLCRLLDDPRGRAGASRALVDAHVDAVRVVVDGAAEARTASVCEALEARVAEALARR